jgi:hypothetical protein
VEENSVQSPTHTNHEKYAMKDKQDDEPSVWVTAIKLVLLAVVLIGGTGLALWYVDQEQSLDQMPGLSSGYNKPDWGIVSDSPLKGKR